MTEIESNNPNWAGGRCICTAAVRVCCGDLDQRVEGLLLVVLWDDLRQQCVLALRQLDEGADAVDVRVDLNVKDVVFSWQEMRGISLNRKHI